MRKGYIYSIKIQNKVYIGQTLQNYQKRWYRHKWALKNDKHGNSHLQRSYNKYGNPVFEIIEECLENVIDDRERYWIAYYNSCDREKGFNVETGGNFNKTVSEETKQKLSDHFKKVRNGEGNPMFGKKLSDERIEQIRLVNQGSSDRLTEKDVEEIKMSLNSGVPIKDLAINYHVDYTTISKINTCVNWYWVLPELNDELKNKNRKQKEKRDCEILSMNSNGHSNDQISEQLGITPSTVAKILKKNKQSSPYKAKHDDEIISKILEMNKKGTPNYIISEELKISLSSITNTLKRNGLDGKRRGGLSHNSKLTEKDIPRIRKLLTQGMSTTKVAELFNVKRQTINDIKQNRTWKHVI